MAVNLAVVCGVRELQEYFFSDNEVVESHKVVPVCFLAMSHKVVPLSPSIHYDLH